MEQQILWHDQKRSWITSEPIPVTNDDQTVLVQATCSMISLGTERLVISEPILQESELPMRIPNMRGDFSDAFTYGYSLVGTVIEGPQNLKGARVHLLHPHQRYALVHPDEVFILPKGLSEHKAMLISNMETVVNACWDAQPSIGDSILIIGYGIIGTLLSQLLCKIPGVQLTVLEIDSFRAKKASEADIKVCNSKQDLATNFDIVFNTAANGQALQIAVDCARPEGLIVELSWYGARTTEVKLGGNFHSQRKKIIASQVSTIPAVKQSVWNHRSRKQLVAKILMNLDTQEILSKAISFNHAPEFYNQLRASPSSESGVYLTYSM